MTSYLVVLLYLMTSFTDVDPVAHPITPADHMLCIKVNAAELLKIRIYFPPATAAAYFNKDPRAHPCRTFCHILDGYGWHAKKPIVAPDYTPCGSQSQVSACIQGRCKNLLDMTDSDGDDSQQQQTQTEQSE